MKSLIRGISLFPALVSGDNIRRLIIDGEVGNISTDPYAVAMLYCRARSDNDPYVCGLICSGSLIAPNVVLTAAHCIRDPSTPFKDPTLDITYSKTYVLMGSYDYDTDDWNTQSKVVRVKKALYQGFGRNVRFQFDGDIALLELEECVSPVAGRIELAKVATKATEPVGGKCEDVTVVGYGQISNAPVEINDADGKRRHISNKLHSFEACRDSYVAAAMGWNKANEAEVTDDVTYTIIPDNYICTGGSSLDSVCFGDSGGPTVSDAPGGGVQVMGVTSFGFGSVCTLSADYSTKVSFYASWIKDRMQNDFATCPGFDIKNSFASWPVEEWSGDDLSYQYRESRCGILDSSKWQCLSGECLDVSRVCNGSRDCKDGSDEDSKLCSYVKKGKSAVVMLAATPKVSMDDELEALIESKAETLEKYASLNVKAFINLANPTVDGHTTRSAAKMVIVGIMKARAQATRPKADERYWKGNFEAPAVKSSCSDSVSAVQSSIDYAKGQNTINDQWNADPVSSACSSMLSCTGSVTIRGYSDMIDFCNRFMEYIAGNSTLVSYASSFGPTFNASCPSDSIRTVPQGPADRRNNGAAMTPFSALMMAVLVFATM